MDNMSGYLETFEKKVNTELIKIVASYCRIDGILPSSQDVEKRWHTLAPEYMVDAIPQINDYPMVSLAWAGYLGMAVANDWDTDWERYNERPYKEFYGAAGFDDMDEHIVGDILKLRLNSPAADNLENIMRSLARQALTLIRRENIEPQSRTAFYVYSKVLNVMFRLGASIELMRLGYACHKIDIPLC